MPFIKYKYIDWTDHKFFLYKNIPKITKEILLTWAKDSE